MIDIGLQSHDFTAAWGVLLGAALICSSALTLSGGFVRKGISNLGLFHGLYNLFAGILLVSPWPLPPEVSIDFIACVILVRISIGLISAPFLLSAGKEFLADRMTPNPGDFSQLATLKPTDVVSIFCWLPYENLPKALKLPLISRYWLAFSRQSGIVSVGHVVFQAGDGFYASIYPEKDPVEGTTGSGIVSRVQNSCDDQSHPVAGFWASPNHDVDRRGVPSYRIDVPVLNKTSMEAVWKAYSQCSSYHLVRRNCALSSVILFEATVSGVFASLPFYSTMLSLVFSFRFWEMVNAYNRAQYTIWSPGVALDYIEAAVSLAEPYVDRS